MALDILADAALAACRRTIICGPVTEASAQFIAETACLGIERIHVEGLRRDVGWRDVTTLRDLRQTFRDLRPDLVHTHSAKPFLLAGIAAWLAGVPRRVHTLHGISFHKFTPPLMRPVYYLLEQFASLFYHSIASVNRCYARLYPIARARRAVDVIPNGIVLPPQPLPAATAREGEFPILFAGRLDEQKDPLFVLDVANAIPQHWKSPLLPRFYLAGSGPLAERVAAEVASRNLGDRVILLGWVTGLAESYVAAKLLFMPSRWEACPLVLIEAAAYGCPAVAARVDGVSEIVDDGRTGLLFEQGNVADACRQIARLAQDEGLRAALASAAREDSQTRGSETMLASYVELYRRLGLPL